MALRIHWLFTESKKYRVKLRRDLGLAIRPECEQVDGKVFWFYEGYTIDDIGRGQYWGEKAMVQNDTEYPEDAPFWIASGDLEPVGESNENS